jgi:uncharacterized protein YukE
VNTEFTATEIRMQLDTLRAQHAQVHAAWHRASKRACGLCGELTEAQYQRTLARCRVLCAEVDSLAAQITNRVQALSDAREGAA